MKSGFYIIIVAAAMLFMHMSCVDTDSVGSGAFEIPDFPLHLRNTSTTSGVFFVYEKWYVLGYLVQGPEWASVYVGTSSDKTIHVLKQTSDWYVHREIDSVVIASGTVHFDCEKWLLINTGSCTWSDEPLW